MIKNRQPERSGRADGRERLALGTDSGGIPPRTRGRAAASRANQRTATTCGLPDITKEPELYADNPSL